MTANIRILLLFFIALSAALNVDAQPGARQEPAAIQAAVENYLRTQTGGLPGKVTYTIGPVDPRVALPACPALEMFLPAGAKLWGSTSIGAPPPQRTPIEVDPHSFAPAGRNISRAGQDY